MRTRFLISAGLILLFHIFSFYFFPKLLWLAIITLPLIWLGLVDFLQKKQAVRRNFPLIGRFRYILEAIRPEINQYFIESNTDGSPLNREQRSLVYQRAKKQLDTLPFGTKRDVYEVGYEWINHSLQNATVNENELRISVGGNNCSQPYNASILNISAMSYGSISKNAVIALNGAAKDGNFSHNTGEGGISPYHLQTNGDLIWQIGTGYFGCRDKSGAFCEQSYAENASLPSVKMIELKLSQGAKPGHGGILPGKKVSKEIAEIRNVPIGENVFSPPVHETFTTPIEMMHFIAKLRELSEGKPVGFKLCVGKRHEFLAICKAMHATGITPDFISIDGGEGGTGAAPLEFSNHIGVPSIESLIFVNNALRGFDLRKKIKIFASGKVTSGFGMIKRLALGADAVYSARAMMLALGCIQALRCNSNHCPTGVTTQDPELVAGLVPSDKRKRVLHFHHETVKSVAEMLGAMGLNKASELRPWHIKRRVAINTTKHYGELYPQLATGCLLDGEIPAEYAWAVKAANADSFAATTS